MVWEVSGEPTVRILSDKLATHYTTCGTLVNRIPQLLAAKPGYRTIDRLPQVQYQYSYEAANIVQQARQQRAPKDS
jgi:hypothetical protein